MIINGTNYPCIGLIRAKPAMATGRWTLSIYPPAHTGLLAINDEAGVGSWAEVEVDSAEVDRIARVAPHLIPGVAYHHRPSLLGLSDGARPKVEGLGDENRTGPSPSMQTVISAQGIADAE